MEFGIHLHNRGPHVSPEGIVRIAQLAEALGYYSVWVADHIIIPAQVASVYPYGSNVVPMLRSNAYFEALTTLSFVASVTHRVRLGTSVLVLPYRPPMLTAKMIATLDVLSHGRVILGIGVGWMEEEFIALQSPPFRQRGAVSDEQLQVFKALWTKPEADFAGAHYRFAPIICEPKPVQQPHPPLWVGGNISRSLRRAVEHGDGWHAVRLPLDELASKIDRLRSLLEAAGRDPDAFTVSYLCSLLMQDEAPKTHEFWELYDSPAETASFLRRLAALGVHHVTFEFPRDLPTAQQERTMERFAREIMPEFRG